LPRRPNGIDAARVATGNFLRAPSRSS